MKTAYQPTRIPADVPPRASGAFILIELLVVIAILPSLLLPALSSAKERRNWSGA